ncbi:hypothetical protein RND71_015914 [Anisodus tanguticus]|uniref:Uncharacterized protein n=1 Tax=Anisodus tanguticus TaxID=243964 RepID=A0AAE1VI57_9SOLA|nr:hypothetical protein RND71_015914 [Anisodus tanguticus]
MLIDVQDTTRLSLGGTRRERAYNHAGREVCRAIARQSSGVVKNRKRQISIFAARVCPRKRGWNKLEGGVPQNKKKEYREKLPFRKKDRAARKWAERRFSSLASNTVDKRGENRDSGGGASIKKKTLVGEATKPPEAV